ncbi:MULTISPECIES: hypothetical protein, partial [unclassified Streptomyces]|uniref:hypothetical protein n=1 Tax=unclassified Streptomyces TaxID=2593676 RepID=UPI00081E4CF9
QQLDVLLARISRAGLGAEAELLRAGIDELYARQGGPVEHCGETVHLPLDGGQTECVLRPGHRGSHANEHGTRWNLRPTTPKETP